LNRKNLTDEQTPMRYSYGMPATKTKIRKRPVILSPLRRSPHHKAIVKAVQELANLRKNDPKAYEATIKQYAGREVHIVPG
jgi:hypothetical protein